MTTEQRIAAFAQLGNVLQHFTEKKDWPGYDSGIGEGEFEEFNALISSVKHYNGWFVEDNVRSAIGSLAESLQADKLNQWMTTYSDNLNNREKQSRVAVIMAGNIPMVAFHDMLAVLMSGNKFIGKLSSDDNRLLPKVCEFLLNIEPEFANYIRFVQGKLEDFDAVIATGSNNTSRYFEYYFKNYPNILRKNRNSVAILDGNESEEQLMALGNDIFQYFGLGCRNVSKLYLPKDYDLNKIFGAIYPHQDVINHSKYANNYDYNKAIYLMNKDELLENGFVLMKEDESLTSPMAAIYYEYYSNREEVDQKLEALKEDIQCIVSAKDIPFGKAQSPELWDYADHVDTMKFLLEL
jgi:hypothetical protein